MADPNILFRASMPTSIADQAEGVLKRQALFNEFQQQPLRQKILETEEQTGRQKLAKAKSEFQLRDMAQDALLIKPMIEAGDIERANALLDDRIAKIKERGGDPRHTIALRETLNAGDTKGALRELEAPINAATRLGVLTTGLGKQQFGAQETFKDEKGNFFFATQSRDPTTGQVKSKLSPIGSAPEKPVGKVQMVSGLGLTADEEIGQKRAESGASERGKIQEVERQKIIKQGVAARGMVRNTERLIELNNLINTGKLSKAKKAFQDVFGITDANLGEFNARAGQLVLGNIRALGANPTEGERAFLSQITPSLEQGGAVNEALLKDLLEVQKRQVRRAKWLAKNPGKTLEEYLLETDELDFQASSSVSGMSESEADQFINSVLQQ